MCSVAGAVGWLGLPLTSQLLTETDWVGPNTHRSFQLVQAWTSPGTLVALVVGSIGLFGFHSRLALVGLIVALSTFLIPILLKLYPYLLAH